MDSLPTAVDAAVFGRIDAHDLDGLGSLLAEDVREDWPVVGPLEGRAAVLGHFRTLFDAMPDFRIEVLRMAAEGENVFVHWRATGTFTGAPFNGVRATGRRIDIRGTDYDTVRDGKVVEKFIAYDGMAFAIQAGVLPRHGTVADRMMTAAVNAATRIRRELHV